MNKRKFYIVLIVVLINVVFYGCESEDNSVELGTGAGEITLAETSGDSKIYVHISGSVKKPGVYSVEDGARLYQVIDLAGGLTQKAKRSLLNLAEPVTDGQKIHILSKKEYKSQSSSNTQDTKDSSLSGNVLEAEKSDMVNINTASEEEFMGLPGIGPSKAAAIVTHREENGAFSSLEDIKNVSGIGDATFSNIKSMITVN